MMTRYNTELPDELYENRLGTLIGQFYKILPLKESGEPTLCNYISGLEREMIGCKSLITALDNDPDYLSLLSILQYTLDNTGDVAEVRSDVFKSIGILKRMQKKCRSKRGESRECVEKV